MNEHIANVGLTNCAQELIHIPGRIQPHCVLLAVSESDWVIRHASVNLEGASADAVIGKPLQSYLGEDWTRQLQEMLALSNLTEVNPVKLVSARGAPDFIDVIAHRSEGLLILELEKTLSPEDDVSFSNIYRRINSTLSKIESARDTVELCQVVADQARALSGFDRVMIYRFDEHWNGKVVAEARAAKMEPFLGLQFPASDIPAQARALYRTNWIRLIPDVHYQPADIVPTLTANARKPLDLSHSVLRSVSPIHIQYLQNMGVGASMSVSVIEEGKLWGLIAFHHESARYLPYELRQGLEFVGKHFSLQLGAKAKFENLDYKNSLKALQPRLFESMRNSSEFLSGLHREDLSYLELATGVDGGAICYQGSVTLLGHTPSVDQVHGLVRWLKKNVGQRPTFSTRSLAAHYPPAEQFKDSASGLMALSIPEPDPSYVLWFKPEVIQTVNWSGNPEKPVEFTDEGAKLSPRRSFALWKETVRLTSLPWAREELEAVEELRRSIIEVDLERQVSSAMRSNAELDQFAHLIAHDLKEPLRGIGSFAEFVREDEGESLKPESRQNLDEIVDLTSKTMRLIGTLHEYSRLGQIDFAFADVDLQSVFLDVSHRLKSYLESNGAELKVVNRLPVFFCDQARISEVFSNLISNAVKYNDQLKKRVEIGFAQSESGQPRFFVRDNGIGISPENQDRIFKMFERLHPEHAYGGGSGSGLALVKRIIDRHSGKLWVENNAGGGSTFYFTLRREEAPLVR